MCSEGEKTSEPLLLCGAAVGSRNRQERSKIQML